jgi:RNA polymerase sigma factor (sigma-70 family)
VLAGSKSGGEDGDFEGTLDFFEDPREDGPDADPHRRELLALISQSLDEEAREIVFLRFFLDYSLKEIADIYGISQSRVSKILGRIMERLKEKLQEKI